MRSIRVAPLGRPQGCFQVHALHSLRPLLKCHFRHGHHQSNSRNIVSLPARHGQVVRLWAWPRLTLAPSSHMFCGSGPGPASPWLQRQCLAVGLATARPSAQPCHPHLCFKPCLGARRACLQVRIFCGFGPGPGCLHCPTGTLLC